VQLSTVFTVPRGQARRMRSHARVRCTCIGIVLLVLFRSLRVLYSERLQLRPRLSSSSTHKPGVTTNHSTTQHVINARGRNRSIATAIESPTHSPRVLPDLPQCQSSTHVLLQHAPKKTAQLRREPRRPHALRIPHIFLIARVI